MNVQRVFEISGVAKNSQWGDKGRLRGLPETRGLGALHQALGNFCNFSIKITHIFAYFGQNNYFKAITHQLKAFEKQSSKRSK